MKRLDRLAAPLFVPGFEGPKPDGEEPRVVTARDLLT
jgi:hypothetical protein